MDKFYQESNELSSPPPATSAETSSPGDCEVQYRNLNFHATSDASSQASSTFREEKKVIDPIIHKHQQLITPFPFGITYKSENEPIPAEMSLKEMGLNCNRIENFQLDQPLKTDLYQLLKEMIEKNIQPNVQIRIGEKNFCCHMMVLQCFSAFFMEFTDEILIELPAEKVSPEAFAMLYSWMLTDTPVVQRTGILELFVAARFLQVDALVKQCWFCFADEICFQEVRAFLLYLEARTYEQEDLQQLMLMRVCKCFLTVVASIDFLQLNHKEVCELLSSNTIGVHSEMEILMSAVRWLSYDWEKRKEFLIEIASCIRFSLMPSWYLISLSRDDMALELDRVVKHPQVVSLIKNGMAFIAARMEFTNDDYDLGAFLQRMQLTPPVPRQWICDMQCNYHFCCFGLNAESANYETFLMYMEKIRNLDKAHWLGVQMIKDLKTRPYMQRNRTIVN